MKTSGAERPPCLKAVQIADTVRGILTPERFWHRTLTFARGFMLESDNEALFVGADVSRGPYHILLPRHQIAYLLNCGSHMTIRSGSGALLFDALALNMGSGSGYTTAVPRLSPTGTAFGRQELTAFFEKTNAVTGLGFRAQQVGEPTCPLPLTSRTVTQAGVETLVRFLVGRGPGLTPSGDDFLVGMRAISPEWPAFDRALETIGLEPEATTTVSCAYFRHALAGRFDLNLVAMVEAMNRQRAAALRQVFHRIAAHGHSSGIDMLAGVLFSLSIDW